MLKKYFTLILIVISFSMLANREETIVPSETSYFESIGKSKIHLQKIPILYMNYMEGKTDMKTVDNELASIQNHLKSLCGLVKQSKDRSLKNQLKGVNDSFKNFKKLLHNSNTDNLEAIDKQQMIIQFQLNNLHVGLENVYVEDHNETSITTLKSNIVVANKQILNLKKYKFNQKMFLKTQDEEYLIDNKDLINELNASVEKLIIDNADNDSFSTKLSSLKLLVNYMRINESHMKTIVDDTSFIFESIRDEYSTIRLAENKQSKKSY